MKEEYEVGMKRKKRRRRRRRMWKDKNVKEYKGSENHNRF